MNKIMICGGFPKDIPALLDKIKKATTIVYKELKSARMEKIKNLSILIAAEKNTQLIKINLLKLEKIIHLFSNKMPNPTNTIFKGQINLFIKLLKRTEMTANGAHTEITNAIKCFRRKNIPDSEGLKHINLAINRIEVMIRLIMDLQKLLRIMLRA